MWTSFFAWLNGQVNAFIGAQVGAVAGLLGPVVVTLATIYVMFWGWLQLTGKIEEPILEGAKRIFTIAAILIFTLQLAANLAPILDVFFNGPQALAAGILGATPMGTIDAIWLNGSTVGDRLFTAGSVWDTAGLSLIAVGVITYLAIGITTLYCAFLLALALVALAILLALGPVFIAMLFFDATKRFFEAWIAQLANYALVIILVATVANLMLHAITVPMSAALAMGGSVTVAAAFRMCVFAAFVLLIMRQILPMAAGLASGIALASGNIVSRSLLWGLGGTKNMGRGMWDAVAGEGTTRWDSLGRKGGYWGARGAALPVAGLARLGAAAWRTARGGNRMTRAPASTPTGKPPGADVPPQVRNSG